MDSDDGAVVITPVFDIDQRETTVTIRGLMEGAHIIVSVPGVDDERFVLVGKRGKIHAFGFGSNSGIGPVRIGGF